MSKINTYFFYIFINVYKDRGCGDLAANIDSTNENPSPIQFPISPLYYTNNSLTFQKNLFLEGLKHLVPLMAGGLSPTISFGEGVNLELQLIIIPGCDRSVSTYKLL